MKKALKSIVLSCLCLLLSVWYIFAEDPDNFSIEVSENIVAEEYVDFTVAAMKDWEILKDYTWSVIFWVNYANGNLLSEDYYTVPNWSWYTFEEADLWKKTFSKWLSIKTAWSYKLIVTTLWVNSNNITAEAVINVTSKDGTWNLETVSISYPTADSTETKSFVDVLWYCEALKNSPVNIYLNWRMVSTWETDEKWDFHILVADLLSWENEIQAKIVDLNNEVLWESSVIKVKYEAPQDGLFKSLEILPWRTGKQWDKFVFNVTTDDNVSSAELIFSNGLKFSMDRVWQWLFSKEVIPTFYGDVDVSISLTQWSDEKIYDSLNKLSIAESIAVTNIKFTATWINNSDVIISWDTIWNVAKYQINYGTWKDDLINSVAVTSSNVSVTNIEKNTTYYFQITPLDEESHKSWEPSEIVEYIYSALLPCVVKWIKVTTEHIWDNYYLIRDPVENAVSYEVYKSDWADMTNSRLVGSLTGTRFQYLFDPTAQKDQYAYYQVQAICPDGNNVKVDNAKEVKVWPLENTLLVIIISIFVYSMYRLNKISDRDS